jgi:hypothetical protein
MKPNKLNFKSFLNPITLLTTLILLAGLILAAIAALTLGRNASPSGVSTPMVTKVAAPTETPEPQPTVLASPTPTSLFFLPDGVIGVGAYVKVTGTDGAGLRMRAEPGLSGTVNFTALDAEVFLVKDGPVDADGYTWWYLEAPYDQSRNGWSAGDFLMPLEEEDQAP